MKGVRDLELLDLLPINSKYMPPVSDVEASSWDLGSACIFPGETTLITHRWRTDSSDATYLSQYLKCFRNQSIFKSSSYLRNKLFLSFTNLEMFQDQMMVIRENTHLRAQGFI